MLIMETSKLHTSCYYCLQHAHIEILAQTYLISFPAEHTAADEDQEEENLRLCNILQVSFFLDFLLISLFEYLII